jgi:hypothetical protein
MGSVRSCREKEINNIGYDQSIIDDDCKSFLVSFFTHIVVLLIMACVYNTSNDIKKISLTLDFSNETSTVIDLEDQESVDFSSVVAYGEPVENDQQTTEEYLAQTEESPPNIEESLSNTDAYGQEPNSPDYDIKDLLSVVSTEINETHQGTTETDSPNQQNSKPVETIEDLVKITARGIGHNRNQPNPFGHLNGPGSSVGARLKAAGAQTGEIQISIAWDTVDDIDLHVSYSPGNGLVDNINWVNRKGHISGGILDIDMNANSNLLQSDPVENIFWPHDSNPAGYYVVKIHFYRSWTGSTRVPVLIRLKIKDQIQTFNMTAILHSSPQRVTDFKY